MTVQDWSSAARMAGREPAETGGDEITEADVLVAFGAASAGPRHPGGGELAKALAVRWQRRGRWLTRVDLVLDAGGADRKTVLRSCTSPRHLGAIQHKVGMANAGVIVAINKDVKRRSSSSPTWVWSGMC